MEQSIIIKQLHEIRRDLSELILFKKEILNFSEACDYLSVSESHMYKLTSKREIPCYQPNGKKLYFRRAELDEWVLSNRKHTNEEVNAAAASYVLQHSLKRGGRL